VPDIWVFGATGFTGSLIAEELARAGTSFGLAGRDRGKLEAMAPRLGGPPIAEAGLDDTAALARAFTGAKVVVSAAGPYSVLGPPVLEATMAAGCHWIDVSGEQAWMKAARATAQGARVAVVPALAFEIGIADALVRSVAKPGDVAAIDVVYRVRSMRPSRGTRRSMAMAIAKPYTGFEQGREIEGPAPPPAIFELPPPNGRVRGQPIPSAEILLMQDLEPDRIRAYFEAGVLTGTLASLLMRLARASGGGLMSRLVSGLMELGPAGPSEASRRQEAFVVAARVTFRNGRERWALARGADAYGLTAVLAAQGARALAAAAPPSTGLLSPARAVPAATIVEILERNGVTVEI
jgi:short subunit dehydrogenase-like uncharacterized protein